MNGVVLFIPQSLSLTQADPQGQTYSLGRNDTTRAATEDKHSPLQMMIMSQERIPESES